MLLGPSCHFVKFVISRATDPHECFNLAGAYSWALLCAINHAVLTEYGIYEEPKEIVVLPPPQFSGFWYTYRINGEALRPHYYDKGRSMILEGSDRP
jgi:hypothetical protein